MRSHLYVTDLTSNLYTVDPATGSGLFIGATGMQITDIAFHGPTLYAVASHRLVRLNPDTGAAVVIGSPFSFTANGLAVSEEGTIYAGTQPAGELITINPVTGAATLMGLFGSGMSSGGDLVFDGTGVLFGTLNYLGQVVLAKINRSTGAATVIGPTGFPTVNGLAFHCCRLFGCTSAGECFSINAATGLATLIGKDTVFMGGMGGMSARACCC